MAKTRKIDDDVADVLERCTFLGNRMELPDEQLDRKLYVKVNKTITDLGGKWNRGLKSHVFAEAVSAAELIRNALASGETVNEKQVFQAFMTPPELADAIVNMADVAGKIVLEPSAGHGALAEAARTAGASLVFCVELHEERAKHLRNMGFPIEEGDFLTMAPAGGGIYPRIVMNPPFTGNQDVKHIEHAVSWLTPTDGVLVSIIPQSYGRTAMADLIGRLEMNGFDTHIQDLPDNAFKSSGTNVRTAVMIVRS